MRTEVVCTEVELFQAMEKRHVRWQRAEIVRTQIEDLKLWKHAQVLQMAWRDLVVGQVQGVKVCEASWVELQLIY